jgi:GAF domain-containing protein
MALTARPDDPRFAEGVAALVGVEPASVLCVPCGDDDVVGVLELIDKTGDASFNFDDVEVAALLAGIAGVALGRDHAGAPVPSPRELGAELDRLAAGDPEQYARVAMLVGALLDRG